MNWNIQQGENINEAKLGDGFSHPSFGEIKTAKVGTWEQPVFDQKRSGAIAIPVVGDGVVLMRHIRHVVQDMNTNIFVSSSEIWAKPIFWELPRGFANENETPVQTAVRELGEETPLVVCGEPQLLGYVVPDTAFFCRGAAVVKVPVRTPDQDLPNIRLFSPQELYQLKLACGYTMSALWMLHSLSHA